MFSKHLALLEKLEDSVSFLKVPLFGLLCPIFFWRRYKVVILFSLTGNFRTSFWGFTYFLSYWRSPLLLLCCSFPLILTGRITRTLARPKRCPVFLGLRNARRRYSAPLSSVLGSRRHAFLFCHSVTNKVSWALFPAFRMAYYDGRLSSSFCRGGDN